MRLLCHPSRMHIDDEFTALPMTRQQKYQLRRKRDGKCQTCGVPCAPNFACEVHLRKRLAQVKRDPLKYKARSAVTLALATGRMKRGLCWCGTLGQAHHKDYSKPLEVTWLCHRHHMEAHGWAAFVDRPIQIEDLRSYSLKYGRTYRQKARP